MNRDPGLLSMVIDQCIVQTTIQMIVLLMKRSLELVFLYSIGKFNVIRIITVIVIYYKRLFYFIVNSIYFKHFPFNMLSNLGLD